MKTFLKPIISIFICAISADACQNYGGFTPEEKEIIYAAAPDDRPQYDGKIMRVWKIDNERDSLLLRQTAEPLTREMIGSEEFRKLCERMMATVTDSLDTGVGIAAPQVGISRQLIFVQRFDKEGKPFERFINPEIIFHSDSTQTGWEGCLSVPGPFGKVERYEEIILKYKTMEFKDTTETINGFTAVIFQHETDHINGKLFIDKATELKWPSSN